MIEYDAMIELPRVKLRVTEATRSTVTGPCTSGSAVPRFSIWSCGMMVSPGSRLEGSASASARNSGKGCGVIMIGTGLLRLFVVLASGNVLLELASNQR